MTSPSTYCRVVGTVAIRTLACADRGRRVPCAALISTSRRTTALGDTATGTDPSATTETDWDRVLNPRTVVVLGASGRADNPMARPLRWLAERGFAGHVVPVNPKYPELAGLPCAASPGDFDGSAYLVLAIVPAAQASVAVAEV